MRALTTIQEFFTRLAGFVTGFGSRPDFVCGDCERVDRCGLPPSNLCIIRAAQITRDGGRPRHPRPIEW